MNRTEIKGYLKDIISGTERVIESLEEKHEWLDTTISKIKDLHDHVTLHVSDAFDAEELIKTVTDELFTAELEEVHSSAEDLHSEIESYADELSETRAEKLLERYEDLESVVEKFSQSDMEYDSINNVKDCLEEALDLLKGMLK